MILRQIMTKEIVQRWKLGASSIMKNPKDEKRVSSSKNEKSRGLKSGRIRSF